MTEEQAKPIKRRSFHWFNLLPILVMVGYLWHWVGAHSETLFNALWQNDDARILLVPLLAIDNHAHLLNDAIMAEHLTILPLFFKWFYQVIMLFTDVYQASKVIQFFNLGLLVLGVLVMVRSRRTGWAAALLLLFFFLHTPFMVNRWAGGLPRGFAFPCLFLWVSGALTDRYRVKLLASVLATAFYPPSMLIILGAEGILNWTYFFGRSKKAWWRRVKRYGVQILLCAGVLLMNQTMRSHEGRIHTYDEAMANPAFKKGGRLVEKEQVPFQSPTPTFGITLVKPFAPSGTAFFNEVKNDLKKSQGTIGLFVLTLLLCVWLITRQAPPLVSICLLVAGLVCYVVARGMAFTFYTPLRYLEYGTFMASVTAFVECIGLLGRGRKWRFRESLRAIGAGVAMLLFLAVIGDGIKENNGMTIKYEKNKKLWDAISALPPESKILAHPKDADGITFWTGRSSTVSYERLAPWNIVRWKRNQKRAQEALNALYQENETAFFEYCKKNKITHVLKKKRRYQNDFKRYAGTFEPLNTFTRTKFRNRKVGKMVLSRVPASSIRYKDHRELISVTELERALKKPAPVRVPNGAKQEEPQDE